MKKLLFALLCAAPLCAQTTTYTGTVKDLTGATVTSGRITWQLNAPSGGNIPGTGSFVASTVSCLINSSGAPVSSVDGTSPCVITNNTSLTPTGTSYTMCRQPYYVTPGSCIVTYATGGTVDISTIVPTPATQPSYGVASTTAPNTWSSAQIFLQSINGTSANFSGGVTAASLNNTILVDQQSGVDICAKIAGAIIVLGSSGGVLDATHFSGTQACASNPLASIWPNTTLLLGNVQINTAVPWTITGSAHGGTESGITIRGLNPQATRIAYTGASAVSCVLCLQGTSPNGVWNSNFDGLTVYGAASGGAVTNTVYATFTHHTEFRNLYLWGATNCGILTQGAVTNTLYRVRANHLDFDSVMGISGLTAPQHGHCFDASGAIQTTDGTVIDADADGTTGAGWYLPSANSMTFTSGTSENNQIGLQISSTSAHNTFLSSDFESNSSGNDVLDFGSDNFYRGIIAISGSSGNSVIFESSSSYNVLDGGNIRAFQDAGSGSRRLTGASVNTAVSWLAPNNQFATDDGFSLGATSKLVQLFANQGIGSFNNLVQAGDALFLYDNGTADTQGIVIGPRSAAGGGRGCRIDGATGNLNCTGALQLSGTTVLPSTVNGFQGAGTKVSIPVYGTAVLVAGTVTVSNTSTCAVGTSCVYKLTHCAPNSSTAIGTLSLGTVTAGTSFVINALTNTNTVATGDLSTVCWQIN